MNVNLRALFDNELGIDGLFVSVEVNLHIQQIYGGVLGGYVCLCACGFIYMYVLTPSMV